MNASTDPIISYPTARTRARAATAAAAEMIRDPSQLAAIVTLLDHTHSRDVLIAALVKAGIIEQPFLSTWDEEPPILLWWDDDLDHVGTRWCEQGQVTESMTALYRAVPND